MKQEHTQHITKSSLNSSSLPTGFSLILKNLREDKNLFLESAYYSLLRLLTYDERLPIIHGLDALNPFEVELFKALEGVEQLKLTFSPNFSPDDYAVQVFYNNFGRLFIRSFQESLPNYGREIKINPIGYLSIPQYILKIAHENVQHELLQESTLRSELDAFLEAKESANRLKEVLYLIDDVIRHIDNVYIYINDRLFSLVLDGYTNLIDTQKATGILSDLKNTQLKNWTKEQRLLIAGFFCLLSAGGASRIEEFNGKQLTATRLFSRLHKILGNYMKYGETLGREIKVSSQMGVFEIAQVIGSFVKQPIGKEWLRTRRINGLTWLKTEEAIATPKSSEVDQAIPESIAKLYEIWVRKTFSYDLGHEKIFSELADSAITQNVTWNDKTPANQPIEFLIQEIVTAAVLATHSDYGMSSSIRNPALLINDNYDSCLSTILKLKPKDFYCCIVSRSGLRQEMGDVISEHIYRPVQARMEYNRWHFIPGNFAKTDIPSNRHYFYPPAIPDLAEWSDQQHPGHLLASVRYSIRSPGPDFNLPPLLISGRHYRGLYDIRVVRMKGVPYNVQDMITARHHCLWMGVVWKRIIYHCEKNPGLVNIIGFEKSKGYEPTFCTQEN